MEAMLFPIIILDRNRKYYYSHSLTEDEQKICDCIIEGLENRQDYVLFSRNVLSETSFVRILDVINLDFPEFFYLDFSAVRFWDMDIRQRIDLGYLYPEEETEDIQQKIEAKVKILFDTVSVDASLPEKEKRIHDFLASQVQYAKDSWEDQENHNIVGAFLNGYAVCEGYAKVFKYLCDIADVLCLVVTGDSVSQINGVRGPHAWNIVRVFGKGCCHVDVTWDSCFYHSNSSEYTFYNQTDDEMRQDHSWDESKVPGCNARFGEDIPYCASLKELEQLISFNLQMNILSFKVKVKKNFKDTQEVLSLSQEIVSRLMLDVKRFSVVYICERNQIEYNFEKE